jgi:hypothetical protein
MADRGVLSARGERVDFDLMKIKQQIAAAPKAVTVKAREDFIDQKFKRRLKRQTQEVIANVVDDVTIKPTNEELTSEPQIEDDQ